MVFGIDSVTASLDFPFIRFTEELLYVSWLAAIMACYANARDEEFTTHGSIYVALMWPFDRHHVLTNIEYVLEERVFEQSLRLKFTDLFIVIWHCADFFNISPAR